MQKLEISLPDDLVDALGPYRDRLGELLMLGLQQVKIHESLLLYTRGLVSFARAAELAAVSRDEMVRQARAAGVTPRWSEDTVREELA